MTHVSSCSHQKLATCDVVVEYNTGWLPGILTPCCTCCACCRLCRWLLVMAPATPSLMQERYMPGAKALRDNWGQVQAQRRRWMGRHKTNAGNCVTDQPLIGACNWQCAHALYCTSVWRRLAGNCAVLVCAWLLCSQAAAPRCRPLPPSCRGRVRSDMSAPHPQASLLLQLTQLASCTRGEQVRALSDSDRYLASRCL